MLIILLASIVGWIIVIAVGIWLWLWMGRDMKDPGNG